MREEVIFFLPEQYNSDLAIQAALSFVQSQVTGLVLESLLISPVLKLHLLLSVISHHIFCLRTMSSARGQILMEGYFFSLAYFLLVQQFIQY